MQVIPLLAVQQVQPPAKEKSLPLDEQQSFPFVLHTNKQKMEEQAVFDEGHERSEEEEALAMIPSQSEHDLLDNIQSIGSEKKELSFVPNENETSIELLQEIEAAKQGPIVHQANTVTELQDKNVSETNWQEITEILAESINSESTVYDQVAQIVEVMELLKQIKDSQEPTNLKEISSRLLPILQQWDTFKQQVDEEKATEVLKEQLTKEQFAIWRLLESNLDKRNHFAHQYGQEAQTTRADLIKWIQGALDRYTDTERVIPAPVSPHQAIPMTEVQQYTVHIQGLDRIDRVSEELTQKVINIINESRLLTSKQNGIQQLNQLTIVLRPEHLGNITVRFMEVDGNMTVKMIVTSQATKELLEANLHQLKHMFSPHQVVIERDESISDDEFYSEKNEKEESEDGGTFEESNESTPEEQNEDTEFDFQSFIEQITKGGLEDEQN